MLIRRELWEHRALWIAPLVVAALDGVRRRSFAGVKYHLTDVTVGATSMRAGV